MLVSGIVATASLVGILVVLLVGGVGLAWLDNHVDAQREH
jgi:hypothetical protein